MILPNDLFAPSLASHFNVFLLNPDISFNVSKAYLKVFYNRINSELQQSKELIRVVMTIKVKGNFRCT
jgi:hypothetical protein